MSLRNRLARGRGESDGSRRDLTAVAVTLVVALASVVGAVGAASANSGGFDAGVDGVATGPQTDQHRSGPQVDQYRTATPPEEIRAGARYFVGQTLYTDVFAPNEVVTLEYGNGTFVSEFRVASNGSLRFDTDGLTPSSFILSNRSGGQLGFTLVKQRYSVSANRSTVPNSGPDTRVALTVNSNRASYQHVVAADSLSAAELRDAFGEGTVTDADGDGVDELVLAGSNSQRLTADFEGVPSGTVTLAFSVVDTTASSEVSVQVGAGGSATLVRRQVVDQVGDVPTIDVRLSRSSRAQLYVGSPDVGYVARATLVDGNGDGRVSVRWNTYLAGHGAEARAFEAVSSSDSVQSVVRLTGDLGSNRLTTGQYPMNVSVGGQQTDSGSISLTGIGTGSQSVSVLAGSRLLAPSQIPARVSERSSVAVGDYVAVRIRTGGVFGYVETASDLGTGTEGVSVSIRETEATSPPNTAPQTIDVSGLGLVRDPANDTLYLFGRTDRVGFQAGDEYRVRFRVDADQSPYVSRTRTHEQTFSVVQRRAQIQSALTAVRLQSITNATLRGTTTLADGSQLSVRLDGDSFSRTTLATVEDGSYEATFDLSGVSPGEQFTVVVSNAGEDLATREGRVTRRATVRVDDQAVSGSVLEVGEAFAPQGGFLVVYRAGTFDGSSLDGAVGSTAYLGPGAHQNVTVALTGSVEDGDELVVALHDDTNLNRTFDFGSSGGAVDGPYVVNGVPVNDSVTISISGGTTTTTPTTSTPSTTTATTTTPTTPTTTTTDGTVTVPPDDDTTTTTTTAATTTTEDDDGGGGLLPMPGFGFPVAVLAVALAFLAARRIHREKR